MGFELIRVMWYEEWTADGEWPQCRLLQHSKSIFDFKSMLSDKQYISARLSSARTGCTRSPTGSTAPASLLLVLLLILLLALEFDLVLTPLL